MDLFEKYYEEMKGGRYIRRPSFKVGDIVTIHDDDQGSDVGVIQEVAIDDNKITLNYKYFITDPEHPDKDYAICNESVLKLQYHDSQWEQYFTESVGNGLPAWRGEIYNLYRLYLDFYHHDHGFTNEANDYYNDTIPPKYMEHILDRHTIYGRINYVMRNHDNMKSLMTRLHATSSELNSIALSLKIKIEMRNGIGHDPGKSTKFTSEEINLAHQIDLLDTEMRNGKKVYVDHFKLELLNTDIMRMIREAYKSARKISARTINQTSMDRRTGDTSPQKFGKVEYEGISKDGTIIRFTYDFDVNVIETAYPLRMNNNAKKH